jgi:UDP-N-acetylmuramoyl-L-alanyl-D-glutamate--2,6-diaminopimelate ligase
VSTTLAAALDDAESRSGVGVLERIGDAEIIDATHDSREVADGWLYCAIPGANHDGHAFAPDAVASGASALLVERRLDLEVPQAVVGSVRAAMGPVAAAVHRHPADRLDVVGVTGTNGKTTTCYLLEAVLGSSARGTGIIGTVETRVHGTPQPGVRTTPEGTELQRLLDWMYRRGVDAVAMEVSSHGLDQRRVDGTRFAVAAFTNLSPEHLDYHGDIGSYYTAKARLFTRGLSERGVVAIDDEWGRRLAADAEVPVLTFGPTPEADVRVVDVASDLSGTRLRLIGDGPNRLLHSRLVGAFNAQNMAAAYLAARELGVSPEEAAAGISACEGVPGRLERVDVGQPFAVLVDYAHTADALERVVETARSLSEGRVHVVIGAGGDRDREKRPAMGRAASGADRAVLTSDNPRTEDPEAILAEVRAGADEVPGAEVEVEVERRAAIGRALREAGEGDVVVIAGKGHEAVQEFAGRTVPFDDRQVAAELLSDLGWYGRAGSQDRVGTGSGGGR